MKKTALTFGLLSGAVMVATMAAAIPFIMATELGKADVIGYSSIVLSALVLFFGIRSHREHAGQGRLTFSRGFAVGVLISLVSWVCYATAFHVMYFNVVPEFGDKFAACMVERARIDGATQQQLDETARRAGSLKQMYDNPITNAALTFATTFPIGVVMSVVAAAILKRK